LKEAPARVVAYFQTVRCVFALFLQLLFSPAGAVAADASAGDLLGFGLPVQTNTVFCLIECFQLLFAVRHVFPGQVQVL